MDELAALLFRCVQMERSCIGADMDALGVVADWLEEHDRADKAEKVRSIIAAKITKPTEPAPPHPPRSRRAPSNGTPAFSTLFFQREPLAMLSLVLARSHADPHAYAVHLSTGTHVIWDNDGMHVSGSALDGTVRLAKWRAACHVLMMNPLMLMAFKNEAEAVATA